MEKNSWVIAVLAAAIAAFPACSGSNGDAGAWDGGGTHNTSSSSGSGSGAGSSSSTGAASGTDSSLGSSSGISSDGGAPADVASESLSDAGGDTTVEGGSIEAGIDGGSRSGDASPGAVRIAFDPMYSAYIPGSTTHFFQVPAIVTGVSRVNVVWSASDPSAVGLEPDDQTGGILITALAAGTFKLNAQIGAESWSASLTVTAFTQADWMAGNARYNDGVLFVDPFADAGGSLGQPPAGFVVPTPIGPSPFEPMAGGPGPDCTNCHGPGSNAGIFEGIDWTPEQTAGFTDQQLVDIIVNGIIPDGGYYDSTTIPYSYWQYFHRWSDLTPEQQTGIVVYLRSLVSAPQGGMVDFGGASASGDTSPDAGTPDGAPDATPDATPE